ncbi:TonB-dependent receptor [Pseudomaricurvus sp. HS19]|uniref:TonB-dependent receptor n=1 Tax=Pseudomaricurvus sp. HS19 TaxID=2692626 RepID=UPI0013705198|nr:TonB-dependent receptor [Pseudomaricurvus sp. HS19]MYM63924.1 TonB-dependent receptor [Pseudomaricurvus sp. HS19]
MKRNPLLQAIALASLSSASILSPYASAQEGKSMTMEEIVVNARRREERAQDVPISMTVISSDMINNSNITNAEDVATYTPSLVVNNRFGSDSTNFAIRGFSQELRTTSSVGVYFAEVVAPRGANTTQSGDGAGPGDFFDLENVQVLKGPQGTLFGRNTTGGAVLLTPKKPTDEYEGYLEGSAGNYDMKRVQGVANLPLTESFKVRLGVDSQQRDGYLDNISGIGPDEFADLDYSSFRVSLLWDITENLENYTIIKYSESENNASPYQILDCNTTGGFAAFCQADLAGREAAGNNGEYDVYSFLEDSKSEMEQAQIINTTTWEINDNLTVKNIASYAEFESRMNVALYGTNWRIPTGTDPAGQLLMFQVVGSNDFPTTDQRTFVEELQFQGTAFDERLTWQAGVYYEKSKPIGDYGALNPSQISCDMSTIDSPDPSTWRCNDLLAAAFAAQASGGFVTTSDPSVFSLGSVVSSPGGVTYENQAIYFQSTYELTDQWSLTTGLRYTKDKTAGETETTVYYYQGDLAGGYFPASFSATEVMKPETTSEEPTWLLGVEYKPTDDLMLFAKYARGYRQGSVNLASIPEWAVHDPEQVDTYEIGAKSSFAGRFPATFNIAAFYNDFQDQQVQFGYFRANGVGTTSVLNAGASTIWGVEMDGSIQLTDSLMISASYSYLNTNVDEMEVPTVIPPSVARFSGTTTAEGEPLPYTPEHSLVLNASYFLPVDESLGDMIATITYVYNDEQQAVSKATSDYAVLPSYELVNASFNWKGILGSPMDFSLFGTNLLDEEYLSNVTGTWVNGLEAGRRGVPRMYGARLRYNF